MDINNKEDLRKLYSFTFRVTGECPSEFGLNQSNECMRDCIYCWRKALGERIEEIE